MKRNDLVPVVIDDNIDLIALVKNIWIGRKIIILVFLFFAVFGLLVGLFSPVKYRSGSVLYPQAEESQDLSQFGGLASLAGINLGDMLGNASGISPDMYPNIVKSYPFLNELVNSKFVFTDESEAISLHEKIEKDRTENKWAKYTIHLPWTLIKLLFPVEEMVHELYSNSEKLVVISKAKTSLHDKVYKSISIEVDSRTGLITVEVEHEDAYTSALIAQRVVDLLQAYIINYKTRQVQISLEYVEASYQEKKVAFEQAQKKFFDYQDANRNRVIERADSKFQELVDEYELSRTIYQNLAQQVEQTRLSLKKETPAFTVIEPVKIPIEKSAPRRFLILVRFSLMGILAGLGCLYGYVIFTDIQASWRKE